EPWKTLSMRWTAALDEKEELIPFSAPQVWSYPRPPALEKVPYNLKVVWNPPPQSGAPAVTIADSNHAWAVKETSHPPTYY
ncbi:unnamed protein product, partial [Tilletia caries]